MPVLLITACNGVYSQPNDLGEVPPGACAVADNVQASRDGIAECRRGFDTAVAMEGIPLSFLYPFDGSLVVVGNQVFLSDVPVTTLSPAGVIFNDADVPFRAASIQGAFYYTSTTGVLALGGGRASQNTGVRTVASPLLTAVVGGSMQATGTQLAYRVVRVWAQGTNERVMMSEPSGRVTIANTTGSAQDVAVSVIADGFASGYAMQVYRSVASIGSTVDPGDELGLVYERTTFPAASYVISTLTRVGTTVTATTSVAHGYQAGDIVGHLGVTDFPAGEKLVLSTPTPTTFTYSEAGAATTASPSIAATTKFIGFVDNVPDSLVGAALYTNATQQGILQANTRPPLVRGDIAEFRRCAFYGNSVERHAYNFRVMSVGSPGGVQVGDTISIGPTGIPVVYTGAATESDTTFAVVTSGTVAENIAQTAQSITRTLSRSGSYDAAYVSGATDIPGQITIRAVDESDVPFDVAFSRQSSVATFGKTSSEATAFTNRVYFSKVDEPEAVPLLNYLDVGSSDSSILRLVPLRDALIVLKEDGVYRITGDGPWNFRVDPFDLTVKVIGARTAATIENTVVVLTDQGVARISDTGVTVISRPIEDQILPLMAGAMLPVTKVLAFGVGYDAARKFLLWVPTASTDTEAKQAWVYDLFTESWVRWPVAASGGVVNPEDGLLYITQGSALMRERKSFASFDYQDQAGASIPAALEWVPKFGDRPDMLHQFREVGILFGSAEWTAAQVGFATDLDASMEFVSLPAGSANQLVRVSVPRTKQRGSRLRVRFSHDQAGKAFQVKGLRVVYETTGERVRR